jgi:hypothetical protein
MAAKNTISPTPLLSEKHNGIPERLFAKAEQAKSAIFDIATKPQSNRTQVAIPQGISENAFYEAIDELRAGLGNTHVELVTKLVDGWYA